MKRERESEKKKTFIRHWAFKKETTPSGRVNGPLRPPIICLNYAIEPKRLALYINTMLLLFLLFLRLLLFFRLLLLLSIPTLLPLLTHSNNVIPYIFVGRLTDHTHNLKSQKKKRKKIRITTHQGVHFWIGDVVRLLLSNL